MNRKHGGFYQFRVQPVNTVASQVGSALRSHQPPRCGVGLSSGLNDPMKSAETVAPSSIPPDLRSSEPFDGRADGVGLAPFWVSILSGVILFGSGLGHLAVLWVTAADWSGPLSLRKPGLFGVSAGVTVWSIAWVLTQVVPHRSDRWVASLLSGGLLLEVGLITLQQWRGVASHFNRATALDAMIEAVMLGLILLVTVGVALLCWRTRWLRPMVESQAIAIRAGLWFLLVSCGLGLLTTIAGELNLAQGRPPEAWGRAGVLKYPHGVALHAIQTLPILSLLLQRLRVTWSVAILRAAVVAQAMFLAHALGQTLAGRTRTDVDLWSVSVLAMVGMLLLIGFARPKPFRTDRDHQAPSDDSDDRRPTNR
jgi:hypothetical protein